MKRKYTPYIYSLFFSCFLNALSAQETTLNLIAKDLQQATILESLTFKQKHPDLASINQTLDSVKHTMRNIGFINIQLDSLILRKSNYMAYLNLGLGLEKVYLGYDDKLISEREILQLGFKLENKQIVFPFNAIRDQLNKIVTHFDAKGQPFVQVRLKELQIKEHILTAKLKIDLNKSRIIDKIIIEGYPEFSKNYLNKYLSIKEGQVFSKNLLEKISQQLNGLQFIEQSKSPAVLFTKDSTLIYLYLKKINRKEFDGLIGFNSKEDGSGLRFNGYLDLSLTNLFNSGEIFKVNWKNNGQERQQFDLQASFPYVFGSKFNPSYQLNIYRLDSSFANTSSLFKIDYALKPAHHLGIVLKNKQSAGTKEVQPLTNYQSLFFGLSYTYGQFYDHSLYKDKISLSISGLSGSRKTDLSIQQSILSLDLSYLWKLKKLHHIYIANHSSTLISDQYLTNELFRLGGANSIRGFNEDQLLAHSYSYFNVEYRFEPNATSYLYSITDVGSFKNHLNPTFKNIYGFGLGYAFLSKIGLINMSYAIGGVSKAALNLADSRFHLKIVTFF